MNRKLNSKFNIIKTGPELNKNIFLHNVTRQFFNPNKAGLFEGIFFVGTQFDPPSYFKKN